MTAHRLMTAIPGDTDVAGTHSIAAPRALYAVVSEPKTKKDPDKLLPAASADRGSGLRLTTSTDGPDDDIINRPGRSTYLDEKSVLTSGATPTHPAIGQGSTRDLRQGYTSPPVTITRSGD